MRAIWNGQLLAESDDTVLVEGNHYFLKTDVLWDFFEESADHTVCPWKGQASYYNIVVNGKVNHNAAWHYPEPSELALKIKDRIAFWKGVEVVK
jgi:uncharacterized protein (DUF427 family)